MAIPKIIHQTWKTTDIPPRFQRAVDSVKRYHADWEYRLWTDEDIDNYVREHHADFYPAFVAFPRHIMRVDLIRYLILYDMGGVYCDLDYEFLRPYDYSGYDMIMSLERDLSYGDQCNTISNYIMASCPGHPFWAYVVDDMKQNPPVTHSYTDVLTATGPGYISRHFFELYPKEQWPGVKLTPRPVFSPYRIHGKHERKLMLNSGITYGFHQGSGTWKERFSLAYLKTKIIRLFTKRASRPQNTQQILPEDNR
jgi:mannosyltransferase OCH1-like enzyme